MPRTLLSLAVLCWLALPLLVHADATFTGRVVGISDGDTVSVLREGKAVKVRLYGIDTPEKKQPFGTQARQTASALAFQQEVTVTVKATDRYGRLVGEVRLPDGQSLNASMVSAGMAWWYRPYAPNETSWRRCKRGTGGTTGLVGGRHTDGSLGLAQRATATRGVCATEKGGVA